MSCIIDWVDIALISSASQIEQELEYQLRWPEQIGSELEPSIFDEPIEFFEVQPDVEL